MLSNATLSRIDRRTGATALGTEVFSTGATLAPGIPVFLDEVSSGQKWTMGATIKDATWVCFVSKTDLAMVGVDAPVIGDQVTVAATGEAAATAQVLVTKDRTLGGLSHWELYLKKI